MKTLKKITIAVVLIFVTISLTSCTDNAEENLNEKIEKESVSNIEKDEIKETDI